MGKSGLAMNVANEILRPSLLSAVIAAAVCCAVNFFFVLDYALLAALFAVAFSICGSFCVFTKMMKHSKRLQKIEDGLLSYERSTARKINAIAELIPAKERLERMERKLAQHSEQSPHPVPSENIIAHFARQEEDLNHIEVEQETFADVETDSGSDSGNVVRLRPARTETDGNDATYVAANTDVLQDKILTPDHIKQRKFSTSGLHIRLQPAISLETREILAFEVSACAANRFGELHGDEAVRSMLSTNKDSKDLDKCISDQVFSMIRAMLRQNKSPLVFVSISAATIKSKSCLEDFLSTLKAQRRLGKNITWEISQTDFNSMSRSHKSGLREILENGYTLCLSDCRDQDDAAEILKEGLFQYAKMPVSELEEATSLGITIPQSELMIACEAEDVQLIVTGVQRESQTLHLIDYNVRIAQGNFFSEPKFPNLGEASDQKSEKK